MVLGSGEAQDGGAGNDAIKQISKNAIPPLWGRLLTCGGLAIRLPAARVIPAGGLTIRRRLTICPHKLVFSRGLFGTVNDQHLDLGLLRFQLQPELFLDDQEDELGRVRLELLHLVLIA